MTLPPVLAAAILVTRGSKLRLSNAPWRPFCETRLFGEEYPVRSNRCCQAKRWIRRAYPKRFGSCTLWVSKGPELD